MDGTSKVMLLVEKWYRKDGKSFNEWLNFLDEISWSERNWADFYYGLAELDREAIEELESITNIGGDFWMSVYAEPEDENDLPEDFPTE